MRLVGDRKAWRAIFSDNYPELVAEGFAWPEGPTWIEEEKALIFSDTITGKLHQYKDGAITLLKEHAGGCAVDVDGGCDSQQLEPGSNGMARVGDRIAVCQHGARRLAFLDLATMKEELIVNTHGRASLNGPNDVVATPDALYFTDPYYALPRSAGRRTLNTPDDKSELGFAGVYRYDLGTKDLELLESSLMRPNGIGIVNGSHLVVGLLPGHSTDCPVGEARWHVWPFRGDGYLRRGAQVKIVHRDFVKKGCSDGLAFHEGLADAGGVVPRRVFASWILDEGEVVAKMHLGRSVSNVAFGGGYAWITADKSLWRVELREERRDRRRIVLHTTDRRRHAGGVYTAVRHRRAPVLHVSIHSYLSPNFAAKLLRMRPRM